MANAYEYVVRYCMASRAWQSADECEQYVYGNRSHCIATDGEVPYPMSDCCQRVFDVISVLLTQV